MEFSCQRGKLAYLDADGNERGREFFLLTQNRDGTRTLRSTAMTDDSKFVRDAVYTLGVNRCTEEALIRLQVGSRWVGSGSLSSSNGELRVSARESRGSTESKGVEEVEQRHPVPERFHVITHAVMHDGWSVWPYDEEAGGAQRVAVYNTSTRWDGTDGPSGRMEELILERIGEETVEVPAGELVCTHFSLDSEVLDVPTSHIWVTGEHNLLVRYSWPGLNLNYVLSELEEIPSAP